MNIFLTVIFNLRLIKFNLQFLVKVFVLIEKITTFNYEIFTNMRKNTKSQKRFKVRVKVAPKRVQKRR